MMALLVGSQLNALMALLMYESDSTALVQQVVEEGHLQQHSPQILATLNPGATAQQVREAKEALGHPLPLAVCCIYRWAWTSSYICRGLQLVQRWRTVDMLGQ
jgi:hypothetical protein